MKKNKRNQLWYNPVDRDRRNDLHNLLKNNGIIGMAADREGQALLESYCRMYRAKL